MIDEGRINGAYPELIELNDKLIREVNNGIETFCIQKMVDLNIDPEVVKLQAMEIQRLRALLQKYEWVPVSERLPEDREEKLVYLSSGRMTIARYNEHKLPFRDRSVGWGYVFENGFIDFETEVVIAWMPLPEPYKGE